MSYFSHGSSEKRPRWRQLVRNCLSEATGVLGENQDGPLWGLSSDSAELWITQGAVRSARSATTSVSRQVSELSAQRRLVLAVATTELWFWPEQMKQSHFCSFPLIYEEEETQTVGGRGESAWGCVRWICFSPRTHYACLPASTSTSCQSKCLEIKKKGQGWRCPNFQQIHSIDKICFPLHSPLIWTEHFLGIFVCIFLQDTRFLSEHEIVATIPHRNSTTYIMNKYIYISFLNQMMHVHGTDCAPARGRCSMQAKWRAKQTVLAAAWRAGCGPYLQLGLFGFKKCK